MSIRGSQVTGLLAGFVCILLVLSLYPAHAQSSAGSSSGGSTSAGSQDGGQSTAGGTGYGGDTGRGRLSSSVSHPAREGSTDVAFGPQGISSPPGYTPDITQQRVYGGVEYTSPQYGTQTGPPGYGNIYNTGYSGVYGASTVQAPAPAASPGIQALSEPAAGESCLTTCMESYTPYECSTQYCVAGGK